MNAPRQIVFRRQYRQRLEKPLYRHFQRYLTLNLFYPLRNKGIFDSAIFLWPTSYPWFHPLAIKGSALDSCTTNYPSLFTVSF